MTPLTCCTAGMAFLLLRSPEHVTEKLVQQCLAAKPVRQSQACPRCHVGRIRQTSPKAHELQCLQAPTTDILLCCAFQEHGSIPVAASADPAAAR